MERIEIIQDLRQGLFDVLIGINLLREGLDIPEVSLVAILDADKEGFLRSFRSFIQIFGRAARNVYGRVIMYAEKETGSMKKAMQETQRRREIQKAYNAAHHIVPATIKKQLNRFKYPKPDADTDAKTVDAAVHEVLQSYEGEEIDVEDLIRDLEYKMKKAAENLEFEQAAIYRDRIRQLTDPVPF
jgi:excinuclease ABC subunit B